MNLKILLLALALPLAACTRREEPKPQAVHAETLAPTNRVDIAAAVRQNLGITFAKVESRAVAQTLRFAGRFELLPTARREYRAAAPGRVEIAVAHLAAVKPGDILYPIDTPRWRELQEHLATATAARDQSQARLASMEPLRAAHKRHEESLATKVQLWTDRVAHLKTLRDAGGGSAKDLAEAQGTLNATQAELADVMEKDAELQAQQLEIAAERTASGTRIDLLFKSAATLTGVPAEALVAEADHIPHWRTIDRIQVRAASAGIVELLNATTGAQVEEAAIVVATVQPELVRFHARAPQADLARLRDGLPAAIVPPAGGTADLTQSIPAQLAFGLTADPDTRTIELVATPSAIAPWTRAGVSAHLEVIVAGGTPELAVPAAAIVRDGATPIIFRRDPAEPDRAIRMTADVGISDGRWTVIQSGVKAGDEIILGGVYPLMLATSGSASKGGHFHSDGTFHEGGNDH